MLNLKLLLDLREYIDSRLGVIKLMESHTIHHTIAGGIIDYSREILVEDELEDYLKAHRKPTFSQLLFKHIDQKGVSDAEIYKKAGIDRRHFSKIRSKPDYRIGKNTAIVLALALELSKKETEQLLNAAGYSLSDNNTFDLIIQFFLEKKIYDLYQLNEALDYFSLKPLAAILE